MPDRANLGALSVGKKMSRNLFSLHYMTAGRYWKAWYSSLNHPKRFYSQNVAIKVLSSPAIRLHQEIEERWSDYNWQMYGIGETKAVAGQYTCTGGICMVWW